jgi:PiT family inorganic phosphate transporter
LRPATIPSADYEFFKALSECNYCILANEPEETDVRQFMIITLVIVAALLLAFANGANDNFKGFATVWGSATLDYRKALIIATIAAIAGSLLSVLLAHGLVKQFSGKGLVSDEIVALPAFALAVGTGAAAAVLIATRVGLPISTTHALVGGLVGAGLAAGVSEVNFDNLGAAFIVPLLASPFVSALIGYLVFRLLPKRDIARDCICVVQRRLATVGDNAVQNALVSEVLIDTNEACAIHGVGTSKASISKTIDRAHIASAATICFARSVNDTPKLAGLMVVANAGNPTFSLIAIATAVAAGGLVLSRRVAETMSQKITPLTPVQGLTANLTTAALVLAASFKSLPVSTTHVSVGAITGVGASARTLSLTTVRTILLSWVGTLPLAGMIAFIVMGIAT